MRQTLPLQRLTGLGGCQCQRRSSAGCPTVARSASLHTNHRSGIAEQPAQLRSHVSNTQINHRHSLTVATQASSSPPQAPSGDGARLAVFVSGTGSNFQAIHAAILAGEIKAEIAVVVSDVPGCKALDYAQAHHIPTIIYPDRTSQADLTPEELADLLRVGHHVDYVILAGYLKLVPKAVVEAYHHAMLNIHPALLPAFGGKGLYGLRVHKAVIASGARYSGLSVHFVDSGYDTGPILAQRVVPVYPSDTPRQLAARILKEEHKAYPEAVAALVDGRVTWREDGIPIMWLAR